MSVEVLTVVARTLDMISTDSERFLVGVFSSMERARAGIDCWIAAHEYGCAPLYNHIYVYFCEMNEVSDLYRTQDEDYVKELCESDSGREARYEDGGGFYLSYRGCELKPRKRFAQLEDERSRGPV